MYAHTFDFKLCILMSNKMEPWFLNSRSSLFHWLLIGGGVLSPMDMDEVKVVKASDRDNVVGGFTIVRNKLRYTKQKASYVYL